MRKSLGRNRARAGQMLVEACIGLALLAFTWIIASYMLFMENNHIRTAMATRHAAWYKGAGGGEMTAEQVDQYFFYQTNLTTVIYGGGEGVTAKLSNDDPPYGNDTDWPTVAKVEFGLSSFENTNSLPYPFFLLNTHLPYMPDFLDLTNSLSVYSVCQWDQDYDTWNTFEKALSGIYHALMSLATPNVF